MCDSHRLTDGSYLIDTSREYHQEVEEMCRHGQEHGQEHAAKHSVKYKVQKRYADYYNSKSSYKQFDVGEQTTYLAHNSNQKMFSHLVRTLPYLV